MRHHAATVIACALATLAPHGAAFAQSTEAQAQPAASGSGDPQSTAQQQFQAGVTAFDAGRHEEALEHFRASLAAYPSPNARLYVARALASLGRVGEAAVEYDRTDREATALAATAPRYTPTADAARAELRGLERRLGRITMNATGLPPSAHVRIADSELTLEELARPVPVTPGRVRVRVEADGFEPAEQDVEVAAGQTVALIPMGLSRAGSGGSSSTPTVVRGADGSLANATFHVPLGAAAGWGVGVLGFAAFGVFAYLADAQYRGLPDRCGQMPCPASETGAIDTGHALEAATNVALVVGIVGLAAGTAWFVWDRTRERPGARRAGGHPPHGVGVGLAGPMVVVGGTF